MEPLQKTRIIADGSRRHVPRGTCGLRQPREAGLPGSRAVTTSCAGSPLTSSSSRSRCWLSSSAQDHPQAGRDLRTELRVAAQLSEQQSRRRQLLLRARCDHEPRCLESDAEIGRCGPLCVSPLLSRDQDAATASPSDRSAVHPDSGRSRPAPPDRSRLRDVGCEAGHTGPCAATNSPLPRVPVHSRTSDSACPA